MNSRIRNFAPGDLIRCSSVYDHATKQGQLLEFGPFIYLGSNDLQQHLVLDARGKIVYTDHTKWIVLVTRIEECK